MAKAKGSCSLQKMELDGYLVHNDLMDWVTVYKKHEPVERVNFSRSPTQRVNWLYNIVTEFSLTEPKPLKLAKEKINNDDEVKEPEMLECLLSEAKKKIIAEASEEEAKISQYGAKFLESRRGTNKMTEMLDKELENIIRELGLNCKAVEVIKKIKELTSKKFDNDHGHHNFWQDVAEDKDERDGKMKEFVFFKDPGQRIEEEKRTVKAIQNRISKIKKEIQNQRQ